MCLSWRREGSQGQGRKQALCLAQSHEQWRARRTALAAQKERARRFGETTHQSIEVWCLVRVAQGQGNRHGFIRVEVTTADMGCPVGASSTCTSLRAASRRPAD